MLRWALVFGLAWAVGSAAAADTGTKKALRAFYAERSGQAFWVTGQGLNARGRALLALLAQAGRHGLDPAEYRVEELLSRACQLDGAEEAAELDPALTRAYLAYAEDLATGRFEPEAVDGQWHIQVPQPQPRRYLDLLGKMSIERLPRALAPATQDYWALVEAATRLRERAARDGWPEVSGTGLVETGDRSAEILRLRERLRLSGDLPADVAAEEPERFDATLVEALKRFQARHGLRVDGILGPRTRRALNVAAEARWRQLMLNLERHRWLPRDLGRDYVLVNTARFELDLVQGGEVRLTMPVIVGERQSQTPVFMDQLDYLVFNPYWNIPESIVREEIAAKVAADPGYLDGHGLEMLESWAPAAAEVDPARFDWAALASGRQSDFPYRLRQTPGPNNALGRVKFMFPNEFSVYLHDTPADQLFDRQRRAFSHGCIRVARPVELAARLLGTDGWGAGDIEEAVASGERLEVRMAAPLPVYILYWTAWVDDRGRVHYARDVYDRDDGLHAALLREGPSVRQLIAPGEGLSDA